MPSVDGVVFLSMAEAFARGALREALAPVFHPLFPLLAAPGIGLGLDAYTSARILLGVAGAAGAALVPSLALRLGAPRGAALAMGLLAATNVQAVRYVGDAYSEPLFLCLVALGVLVHLARADRPGGGRGLALLAGLLAGLAFTARPEGAALALAFLLLGPRRAWCGLGAALPAGLYLGARTLLLSEATLSPKIGFMWELGPLAAPDLPSAGVALVGSLARGLLLGAEALGPLAWVLSLAGLVLLLRGRPPGAGAPLLALLIAWLGMAAFQVKRRFLVDWSPLLLAAGALAWAALAGRAHRLLLVLLALSIGADLYRLAPVRKEDREAEVALGRWLAGRLAPGEELATDMPRVAYYAGRTPPPPRVPEVQDLELVCARPQTSYLVLGARRELLQRFGPPPPWLPLPLPPELARGAEARGIAVFYHPARIGR